MSAKSTAPRLSAGELEIMEMLWRAGSVTLADAQAAFARPIGYTTMQTRLNRLAAKGLVRRGDERPARYSPLVKQQHVTAGHLEMLLDRVSGNGGGVVPLVAHLVRERKLSKAEIAELKGLIAEAEDRQADPTASARGKRTEASTRGAG